MFSNPIIILNEKKAKSNIKKMYDKAIKNNLIFRPHFKTHQSKEIGQWYKQIGTTKITVSSVDMALYFIEDGWNDITIAFPFNIHELFKINNIKEDIKLNLVVESEETLLYLSNYAKRNFNIFIKIDIGYHRTGIDASNIDYLKKLLLTVKTNKNLIFDGFLGHAGHSYNARSNEEILEIHNESLSHFKMIKETFKDEKMVLSSGDTPTCSIAEYFPYIDEIRPGNFVFYDVTQAYISSCALEDIAITLKCPVVSKNKDRNEVLVYGGGVHFSKDRIYHKTLNKDIFGILIKENEEKTDINSIQNYMSKLSQEHGTLKVTDETFEKIKIGDFLEILPIHSCMTSNLMKEYYNKQTKKIIRRF